MVALKRHSINLYRELANDPEHPFACHITGGMRLAHTPAEVDTYKHFVDMAAGVGVEMAFIDANEVARRHPLINAEGLLGAWWDPLDGDIDPAGITTFRMALVYSVALVPVTYSAVLVGLGGWIYLAGATVLGLGMLYAAYRLHRERTVESARHLFFASLAYLPTLFLLMLLDPTQAFGPRFLLPF